ncbi:MAG TPA: hypothetical protein VME40_03020 [Caulobacteraceae bacterium]|nr:hypothetical protein [Caulobacteraceae bacterium]
MLTAALAVSGSALAATPPSGAAQQAATQPPTTGQSVTEAPAARQPAMARAGPAAAPGTLAGDAVAALEKVCLPVLHGGKLEASARAAGFKLRDGVWTLTESGDRSIMLNPPDPVNPRDCGATITARAADDPAVRAAVDAWAQSQTPPLTVVKSAVLVPGSTWQTSTWQAQTPAGEEGVALSQQEPAASSPPNTPSQSNLLVSLTPA